MGQVKDFMQIALNHAQIAFEADEVPVGAVIAKKDQVIATAANAMKRLGDPTAHAEMIAIRKACEVLKQNRLIGCTLYVTLEPCPMCLSAISFARLDAIYYGASDPKSGGVSAGNGLVGARALHHKPEIYEGFCEVESAALLKAFFEQKRG